jgi:hypothetical protein
VDGADGATGGNGGVDARIVRCEQGLVTIVLLAGFVFAASWTIPAAAILVALDAALADAGPVPQLWRATWGRRAGAAPGFEDPAAVRLHAAIVGGALVVATVLLYAGAGGVATLLAILVAAVTAACATGLFCAGCELRRHLTR